MNKRIYDLATRAGAYCETYLYGGDPKPPVLDSMNLEKFAELIVQDCIKVLNSRFMGDLNREDMEVRRCVDDIKKHFGIEE